MSPFLFYSNMEIPVEQVIYEIDKEINKLHSHKVQQVLKDLRNKFRKFVSPKSINENVEFEQFKKQFE